MRTFSLLAATAAAILISSGVIVQAFVVSPLTITSSSGSTNLHAFPPFSVDLLAAHQDSLTTTTTTTATTNSLFFLLADVDGSNSIIDILRSIAVGITAILFLGAGLTYVTAALIIPAAAKELEKECMELAPDLWREYQAKLEPNQSMAQRPDLMQELGVKLQPLIDQKIARMDAATRNAAQGPSVSQSQWMDDASTVEEDDQSSILDAQIIVEEDKDSEKDTTK